MKRFRRFIKGFTLVEAIAGAVLLSIVVGGASEYYISKVQETKDADTNAIIQSITTSTGKSLAAAYSSEIQRNLDALVKGGKSQSDVRSNIITLGNTAKQSVLSVIQEHFKDPVFYANSKSDDPLKRSSFGADNVDEGAPVLTLPSEAISVPVVFHKVTKEGYSTTKPNISNGANNRLKVKYQNKKTNFDVNLYNTLLVSYRSDVKNLKANNLSELANLIATKDLAPTDVTFAIITEGETSGVSSTVSSSSTIANPFSEEFLKRLASPNSENIVKIDEPEYDDNTGGGSFTKPTTGTVTICTCSEEKVYDGLPLSHPDWYFKNGQGFGQHAYVTNVRIAGAITDVGSIPNALLDYKIIDNDKYLDYIVKTEIGTLTILPRQITVASKDATQEYNGKPIPAELYKGAYISSGTLAPGDKLAYSFETCYYVTGTHKNKFSVKVINGSGRDVTHNYQINKVYGKLTYTGGLTLDPVDEDTDPPIDPDGDPYKYHICFILDKSKSMKRAGAFGPMREATNRLLDALTQRTLALRELDKQRLERGEISKLPERTLTADLITFNKGVSYLNNKPGNSEDVLSGFRLTTSNYKYHKKGTNIGLGLGRGIESVESFVLNCDPAKRPGKVVVVLFTDAAQTSANTAAKQLFDKWCKFGNPETNKWQGVLLITGVPGAAAKKLQAAYGFEYMFGLPGMQAANFNAVVDNLIELTLNLLEYQPTK